MPYFSMTGASSSVQRRNASSQPTSCHCPSTLIIGVRMRSGSSCTAPSVAPFGQMCPRLQASSRLPRMPATWPSCDLNLQAAHGLTQRAGVEVPAVFADRRHVQFEFRRHRGFLLAMLVVTHCID